MIRSAARAVATCSTAGPAEQHPGNDLLDGGDGIDLARFGFSTAVTIDLVAGTAMRGGETDTPATRS